MLFDRVFLEFYNARTSGQEYVVEPAGNNPRESEQDPTAKSAWRYASEGTQLAATLLIGVYLGYKLDAHQGTSPWFTLAGSVLGIGFGLYNFLRSFLKK